ncbi:NAD(P)-dependent oxidoreductase [Micromonospora arida]|uniref:Flavin reductase n=1 Tax=Micromonospora arida TaxID=2203715 RepID=A0A3N9XXG1_9ACTN|nr:NAD(P)H-binding protein [Micromonospora arida]RQX11617.1 flavin reductase [Micromonospora arida]
MSSIAIFGAGGRAGRAITAEARDRGHRVTAAVRDPRKAGDTTADGISVVRGDVTDPRSTATILHDHDAVVSAVTPASSPEALAALGHLDDQFFVNAADALLHGMTEAGVVRLILIGLFANLQDEHGRLILDDPASFPGHLRPFALAHTAGLDRLRAADTTVDWLMLTPPAMLDAAAPRRGRYRLAGDTVTASGSTTLSYADLAVAVIDEIEAPRHHRTRVSIFD